MSVSTVWVKIAKKDDCVFEKSLKIDPENNLKNLISNLKETQHKVNEFLTTLVEERNDLTKDDFDEIDSDDDSIEDSADDLNRLNPKKCKLSD